MKTFSECIKCFIDDISEALFELTGDERKREEFLKIAISYLKENLDFQKIPSIFITGLHRLLKIYLKEDKPFLKMREKCNILGVKIREKISKDLSSLSPENAFRKALLWSIAGNHLDMRTVGMGYDRNIEKIEEELEKIMEEGLFVDDADKLLREIKNKNILFVHDNVGEIAIDCLLMEYMKKLGAKKIISALRTLPMTSDATLEDGKFVGIDKFAHEVIPASPDTLGVIFEEMTEEFKKAILECHFIITKGQANFYSFHNKGKMLGKDICFLLRTKCFPVSRIFGANKPTINLCYLEKH